MPIVEIHESLSLSLVVKEIFGDPFAGDPIDDLPVGKAKMHTRLQSSHEPLRISTIRGAPFARRKQRSHDAAPVGTEAKVLGNLFLFDHVTALTTYASDEASGVLFQIAQGQVRYFKRV